MSKYDIIIHATPSCPIPPNCKNCATTLCLKQKHIGWGSIKKCQKNHQASLTRILFIDFGWSKGCGLQTCPDWKELKRNK